VWLRPEVLPSSVGRKATSIERSLESYFTLYLRHLVENSDAAVKVIYKSATRTVGSESFTSLKAHHGDENTQTLEIHILSPAFFSRFVHYAYTSEAFDRECIFTDEKNRTVWISRPELLPLLLNGEKDVKATHTQRSAMDHLRWIIHKRLRCPPAPQVYTFHKQAEHPAKVEDIRLLPFSSLDHYVQAHCEQPWLYRRQCMRLFLAQRLVLGFAGVIDGLDLLTRSCFVYFAVSSIFHHSTANVMSLLKMLVQLSLVHIWSFGKGSV